MTIEAAERLRRLPRIKRARGYRLYAVDGRRYVDMWQAGGRAILGHRGGGVVTAVKRVLERGVLAPMPSAAEHRLVQAMRRLLAGMGEFEVAVFATEERALREVSRTLGMECVPQRPSEPFDAQDDPGSILFWRPFLPPDSDPSVRPRYAVLFPVLPDGALFSAQVVVYRPESALRLHSDLVSEPALTALAAAAHGLVSSPARPVVALEGFLSRGPYLIPEAAAADASGGAYDALFDSFLAAGVVMSPDPAIPSIIPAELSDGEWRQIRRAAMDRGRRGN